MLDLLLQELARKNSVALVADLETGRKALIGDGLFKGELELSEDQLVSVSEALVADRSGILPGEERFFVQTYCPAPRMVIVGAVHVAQALVPMAELAGYDVVVIDPRRVWSTTERFPGVVIDRDWPDVALERLALDRRTAVVALSHDPKLDDPALTTALRSDAFYVGALGSKRTHTKRLKRLSERGVGDQDLARIYSPVGLAIGASSPAEIAISIMAQVTLTLHGAQSLESPTILR